MIADWLRVHRRALAAFAVLLAAAFMFRGVLSMLIALCLGGAALAFVMLPLVKLLSRRMKRTAAILTAFGCVALLIIGAVFMIVPTIIDQARILIESLPDMYAGLTEFTEQISAHVEGFLGEDVLTDGLSQLPGQVSGMISTLLSGAGGMAGGIADGVGRLSLIVILAYYFLKDRERMLMQLELLLPSSIRARVIEAGGAIQRELSGYVRGAVNLADSRRDNGGGSCDTAHTGISGIGSDNGGIQLNTILWRTVRRNPDGTTNVKHGLGKAA